MEKLTTLTMNEKTYNRFAGNLPQPATATVGQVLVVAAVDDDGNVTEVEAVDQPSGGGAAPFCVVSVKEGGDCVVETAASITASVSVTSEDYIA